MKFRYLVAFLLIPVALSAQNAPLVGTTLKSTSASVTSLCVGCALGSTTPVANSGAAMATLTMEPLAAPVSTTNKIYNLSGLLSWGGGFGPSYVQFPTAAAAVPNGVIQRITTTGLTNIGVAGSTYDWSVYIPSGASPIMGNPTGTTSLYFGGSTGFGSSLTDLNTTPTIQSGFGTGNTIAGKAFAFIVTVGSSSSNTGTIAFNGTYTNAPVCVVSSTDLVHTTWVSGSTATTVTFLSGTTGWDEGTVITVLCRGY